jgi:hypothetical protein
VLRKLPDMKTVGYIFDTQTFRLDGLIRERWVGVYFCDLKEPKRFTTIERAVEYSHDQYLHLLPLPADYLPNERWTNLDREDWAEVTYRMAQLEREDEPS